MSRTRGRVRNRDGTVVPSAVDRWFGPITPADDSVLARVVSPALDVGCGPGRHVIALAERALVTLGIDITPYAVSFAQGRGAPVLERSVFERVPGAGRWATALLLDGNAGIGGNAVALLRRVASLLRPGGQLLLEADPPGSRRAVTTVRLEVAGRAGPWFSWAPVPADALHTCAARAGCRVRELWRHDVRWFAALERDG
jgi:SAM-dependent methyltransferase